MNWPKHCKITYLFICHNSMRDFIRILSADITQTIQFQWTQIISNNLHCIVVVVQIDYAIQPHDNIEWNNLEKLSLSHLFFNLLMKVIWINIFKKMSYLECRTWMMASKLRSKNRNLYEVTFGVPFNQYHTNAGQNANKKNIWHWPNSTKAVSG